MESPLQFGAMIVVAGQQATPLLLKQTTLSGQISGPLAAIRVEQHFANPFTHPVTLEYLFPLPEDAAITHFQIVIGARTVQGQLQERGRATQTYEQAVAEGKRAALLTERRPNLFAIQIGNVQPGEAIRAEIGYDQRLRYADGAYQFVFPMGLTPKYHSPSQAPIDAAETTAPITFDTTAVGPVELQLSIDMGVPLGEPTSPTHPLTVHRESANRVVLSLDGRHIPDRDFTLRLPVATDAVQAATWVSQASDGECVLVTVLPPRVPSGSPPPREFIFVIDRSGSMSQAPMDQARNALKACLRALNETDTFAIQAFDDKIEWFTPAAQPLTQAAVDAADRWLDGIHSRGGTEIYGAVKAALNLPTDPARRRFIVFLTDGAVSDEARVLAEVAKLSRAVRIFTFGIGSSVNRALLAKMAQFGRGVVEFLTLDQDIETAMTRFQDRISYPALQDLSLVWEGAETWDSYPATLPDLYIGQPLEVAARLKRSGPVTLRVTGQRAGVAENYSVGVPAAAAPNPAVDRAWAKARLTDLIDYQMNSQNVERLRQQVIGLALEYKIVTAYTAFVAVDSEITTGGAAQNVAVAVPLPHGVTFELPDQYIGGTTLTLGLPTTSPMAKRAAPPPGSPRMSMARAKFAASDPERERAASAPAMPKPISEMTPADLSRIQKVNGSWGDDVEQTAKALLKFVEAGHTTRAGNYRRHVEKAAKWLREQLAAGLPQPLAEAATHALNALAQAEAE
jgi:Ca-activated chloride channel family protein